MTIPLQDKYEPDILNYEIVKKKQRQKQIIDGLIKESMNSLVKIKIIMQSTNEE